MSLDHKLCNPQQGAGKTNTPRHPSPKRQKNAWDDFDLALQPSFGQGVYIPEARGQKLRFMRVLKDVGFRVEAFRDSPRGTFSNSSDGIQQEPQKQNKKRPEPELQVKSRSDCPGRGNTGFYVGRCEVSTVSPLWQFRSRESF